MPDIAGHGRGGVPRERGREEDVIVRIAARAREIHGVDVQNMRPGNPEVTEGFAHIEGRQGELRSGQHVRIFTEDRRAHNRCDRSTENTVADTRRDSGPREQTGDPDVRIQDRPAHRRPARARSRLVFCTSRSIAATETRPRPRAALASRSRSSCPPAVKEKPIVRVEEMAGDHSRD